MNGKSYTEQVNELLPKLDGDVQAQVLSVLVLAEAIDNLASEVCGIGTEAHPVHTKGEK